MIMGHIGFSGYFDKFIHAFHMPMFFIVSGMFFKIRPDSKLSTIIKRSAKALLLPYLVFGILHYIAWVMLNWSEFSWTPLKKLLFVNTDGLPIAGALWFLTAMFFARIMYFCIRRFVKNPVAQHLLVVAVSIFGCIAALVMEFRLPYALDAAFVGVGLMHIGCLLHENRECLHRLFELKYYETLILSIITTVLIFANGYINMRAGTYAIIPLFWVNAVLATVIGINIAKYVERFTPRKVCKILSSIGQNSIVYLCLNQIVILVVTKMVGIVVSSAIISKLMILIISMILLFIVEHVFMNTKLKVMFGK